MGAPPPTTAGFSVTVKIKTDRIGTATKRAQLWQNVEKILKCWGSDILGQGNTKNGLKFQLDRDDAGAPQSYTVWFEGTGPQRNMFLGAYKKARAELETVATDRRAYVNEWNDVKYSGRSLADLFKGALEPGDPQEPVTDCPTPVVLKTSQKRRTAPTAAKKAVRKKR